MIDEYGSEDDFLHGRETFPPVAIDNPEVAYDKQDAARVNRLLARATSDDDIARAEASRDTMRPIVVPRRSGQGREAYMRALERQKARARA